MTLKWTFGGKHFSSIAVKFLAELSSRTFKMHKIMELCSHFLIMKIDHQSWVLLS